MSVSFVFYIKYLIATSAINTAAQEQAATFTRLFSKNATATATTKPIIAVIV